MIKIKELRGVGDKLGREGMSQMAQKFISEYDGSYKGAMKLCGQLSVIAKMATCDDYLEEQVDKGVFNAECKIELIK